jgi:hypothetical protein
LCARTPGAARQSLTVKLPGESIHKDGSVFIVPHYWIETPIEEVRGRAWGVLFSLDVPPFRVANDQIALL